MLIWRKCYILACVPVSWVVIVFWQEKIDKNGSVVTIHHFSVSESDHFWSPTETRMCGLAADCCKPLCFARLVAPNVNQDMQRYIWCSPIASCKRAQPRNMHIRHDRDIQLSNIRIYRLHILIPIWNVPGHTSGPGRSWIAGPAGISRLGPNSEPRGNNRSFPETRERDRVPAKKIGSRDSIFGLVNFTYSFEITNHNQLVSNIKYLTNLIKKYWTYFRYQKLADFLVCLPPSVRV